LFDLVVGLSGLGRSCAARVWWLVLCDVHRECGWGVMRCGVLTLVYFPIVLW